ncbi:DNA polymerase III subunit beta [Synechococcus sp. Tobar12-5m-g]|uniref:DNA polymerase III subunit beta n=1 Tax=unclassified Synechococcus TaxID=2626047 RepID=UPI0020CBAC33|nr:MULTISPECIES: DNA polymerase III subunit beta [unclassified Synechococcus]MCP9772445.1 DNA polymerase III subunit beta [Synechococcus sp. Tobar12-5m-g]MCP9874273.1 DNA polymerase III subunit beta [Synechococcus sp. Cruz CV-v-12]
MKLVCSQSELSASLQLVSRAVSARPTHPVLANVLLTADAGTGRLSLTGFDLSLGIQTSLAASVETSGAITLPSKLFVEIVSRLSADSPITLSCEEGQDQVELTSRSGTYQMRGLSAEDFPDLPLLQTGAPIRLNVDALVRGLRATLFASSGDEAKQLLTGVHLGLEHRGLECAATDGHRLSVLRLENAAQPSAGAAIDHEAELDGEAATDTFAVTVPARSLRELERLLSGRQSQEAVSLYCDRGQVVFLWADQVLTSRSLDGTYPNYRQLIPTSFSRSLELDRRGFITALERVAVLADQHNNVVKISSDPATGQLHISADAQDVGSGSEDLAAVVRGEPIAIAFNVRYVLDGLKAMAADRVELRCNAPTTPAVLVPVDDPSFTYLVMPVQIRS